MSEIVEKVLKSGLIDKHVAELMERFGMLSPGESEKASEVSIATREQMAKLAEEFAVIVDRDRILKETNLDVERLHFPVNHISIMQNTPQRALVAAGLTAMQDRMGRYFFRAQDINPDWFRPGYTIERFVASGGVEESLRQEIIHEADMLYSGSTPLCMQVTAFLK